MTDEELPHPPEDDPNVAFLLDADDEAALAREAELLVDTAKPHGPGEGNAVDELDGQA